MPSSPGGLCVPGSCWPGHMALWAAGMTRTQWLQAQPCGTSSAPALGQQLGWWQVLWGHVPADPSVG